MNNQFKTIMLLTALALSSSSQADGVDDPNFYKDFENNPCSYDLGAPCSDDYLRKHQQQLPKKATLENPEYFACPCKQEHKTANVPEPKPFFTLAIGLALIFIARTKLRR
jgi:hypothetical protein